MIALPGGAANVSVNLQALGANPILVSIIGNDNKGHVFLNLLQENNLTSEGIEIVENRMTTVKTRIISGGQQISRVDEEVSTPIDTETTGKILRKIQTIISAQRIDIVIFVDYDKGLITPELIREVTALARKKNILIAVDPKYRNFHEYQEADLFKPNFKEFNDGLGLGLDKTNLEEIKKAAEAFKKEKNHKLMFITMSEMGVFTSNGIDQNHFPAQIRDIADVSGAGDTVVAVASLCLAASMPVRFMAQLANLAGGLVCEKAGVVPIDKDRLKTEAQKMKLS